MLYNIFLYVAVLPLLTKGAPSRIVELSYTFNEKTPNYPRHSKFKSTVVVKGTEPYGIWVASNDLCSSEHSGTHMDAPYHLIDNATTVDLIPYEKLYRVAGIKVDVTEKAKLDKNYGVTVQDMEDWVQKYGDLPDGVVVLFETGWGKKSHDADAYSGFDEMGKMNFPGIGKDAAQWMVDYANKTGQKRGVIGVGVDTLSLDVAQPFVADAHLILLGDEMFGLENVKNMHMLPAGNFTLTMLPMKIGGGTGGPTRVLAELGGIPYFDASM